MWKPISLAFAAVVLAGSAAMAQQVPPQTPPNCTAPQRNGATNVYVNPDWIFDQLTQQWLAPNSPEAARAWAAYNSCVAARSGQEQALQQQRQREEDSRARGYWRYENRYGYGNYQDPYQYSYNGYYPDYGYYPYWR